MFTGQVMKRGKVGDAMDFTSPKECRQLILTAHPRFVYVDPVSNMLRGEIMWTAQTYAEFKAGSETVFYIKTVPHPLLFSSFLRCGFGMWR